MNKKIFKEPPAWLVGGLTASLFFLSAYLFDTAACCFNSSLCFGITRFLSFIADAPSFVVAYFFKVGYIWATTIAVFMIGALIGHLVKIIIKIKKSKGFTIIELLVVIAIIAVIATVIIFGLSGQTKKSKDTAVKSELAELQKLSAIYASENGNFLNFSTYPDVVEIIDSIKSKNFDYIVQCYDQDTSYVADSMMGRKWLASMLPPTGPGFGDPSCSPTGWYCYVMGIESTTGCWCTDSSGVSKDSCGGWQCACQ